MYGAKLQLHLSPRRLPILHFRIVRHSFRRSFPSFLPSFLSFFFLPPSLSPLPFFRRDRRFLASRPIVTRYVSPRFPEWISTHRALFDEYSSVFRLSNLVEKEKIHRVSRLLRFFFFFFKREKEGNSKKDYEYSGSVCSGMKIISNKSEIIFVFGCEWWKRLVDIKIRIVAPFRETLLRYRVIFPGVYTRNREVTLNRDRASCSKLGIFTPVFL